MMRTQHLDSYPHLHAQVRSQHKLWCLSQTEQCYTTELNESLRIWHVVQAAFDALLSAQ
jgi:hypothetical protein